MPFCVDTPSWYQERRVIRYVTSYGFVCHDKSLFLVMGNIVWENVSVMFYLTLRVVLTFRLFYETVRIKMYRAIILSVVLYGSRTWSPTMREHKI
jgi:hypothetical protein